MALFRERAFKALLEHEATSEDRVALVRSWVHSSFNVDSSRRLQAEDRQGLQSLLEYMERAPVALERLEYRSDGLVHYRGNYHPALRRDHQLLPAVDFLALLVPHVLLRYEASIRCYGALSTTIQHRFGWIKKDSSSPTQVAVVEIQSELLKVRRRSWARLIARVWCENPALCPTCGKEVKILAAITSPGQDDVIEKILRTRGEWLRRELASGEEPGGAGYQRSWSAPRAGAGGSRGARDREALPGCAPARRVALRSGTEPTPAPRPTGSTLHQRTTARWTISVGRTDRPDAARRQLPLPTATAPKPPPRPERDESTCHLAPQQLGMPSRACRAAETHSPPRQN